MELKREFFVCSCNSLEHQMTFWYDEENKFLYTEVHLTTWHNFFKRLWYGLRYAFGHKCNYGAWDEFLFETDELTRLKNYLIDKP